MGVEPHAPRGGTFVARTAVRAATTAEVGPSQRVRDAFNNDDHSDVDT